MFNRPAGGWPWSALFKFTCFVLLIVVANLVAVWLADALNFQIRPSNEDLVHRTVMITAVAYALLLAIPFVPGAEVGLALIAMLGPGIVILVYLCTLTGLSLSFLIGRLVPLDVLIKFLSELNFRRTSQLLESIRPMNTDERLAFVVAKAPNRLIPFLLRYRYIALAVMINLPGNILLGGGGGIALMAGISKFYSITGFLVTIAIAVSPVPLTVLVFGSEFFNR